MIGFAKMSYEDEAVLLDRLQRQRRISNLLQLVGMLVLSILCIGIIAWFPHVGWPLYNVCITITVCLCIRGLWIDFT